MAREEGHLPERSTWPDRPQGLLSAVGEASGDTHLPAQNDEQGDAGAALLDNGLSCGVLAPPAQPLQAFQVTGAQVAEQSDPAQRRRVPPTISLAAGRRHPLSA